MLKGVSVPTIDQCQSVAMKVAMKGRDCRQCRELLLGSLSMHVFETRTTTGIGHFACQDNGIFQIFIPSISNGEKILGNANAVV